METNLSLMTVSIPIAQYLYLILLVLDNAEQPPMMGRPIVEEHQEEVKGVSGQLIDTTDKGNKVFEAMVGPDRYATA